MNKKERAEIASIIQLLGEVGYLPMPIFLGTRHYLARAAVSDAHFRLSQLLYAAQPKPPETPYCGIVVMPGDEGEG